MVYLVYKFFKPTNFHNSRMPLLFTTKRQLKQYNDIPRKKGFIPSTIELIFNGGPNYLHEHCDRRHNQLGPIFREHLGPIELIFLSDTKLIQTVIANEGQFPHHSVPPAWIYYNKLNNINRGLFFQIGEPWAKLRKVFNKVLLSDPNKITRFGRNILEINSDLLNNYWNKSSIINSNDFIIIDDVKPDLCKWSIESTGLILFGNRMGCINDNNGKNDSYDNHKSRGENLVKNVTNMFKETSKFQLLPVEFAHKFNLNCWKNFQHYTKNMLLIANQLTTENIEKVKLSLNNNNNDENFSITKDLLKLNELKDEEISQSLVDLIIASADTTSNSLQWMLYLIAKHKDVQDKLLNDADILLSKYSNNNNVQEKNYDRDQDEQASYLRAFMKEVARMYPTAPFLARTLEKDINLGGYLIPAGKPIVFSLFTTSRSEKYFDEPLKFKPERWFRNQSSTNSNFSEQSNNRLDNHQCPFTQSKKNHAYASLPFGIGTRMCIGRRAAELQMSLFLASFVKTFESSLFDEDRNVDIRLEMILCPSKPIRLKLKQRII